MFRQIKEDMFRTLVVVCVVVGGHAPILNASQSATPQTGPGPFGRLDPCYLTAWTDQSAQLEFIFAETAWRVRVQNRGLKGLWIGPVEFRRPEDSDYQLILKEAGPAEIFVVYHEGPANDPLNPPRLYDMRYPLEPFGRLVELGPSDLPAFGGSLVTLSGDDSPRVVTELRDRGPAWLCKGPVLSQGASRRGQEAVVWAVYDGGNYDNIIQYAFRDDGTITFRLGVTGYNHPGIPLVAHMHNCLWRIDVDLFGALDNIVLKGEHVESAQMGAISQDVETVLLQETAIDWDPTRFTSLKVEHALIQNAYQNSIGYELLPWNRTGSARHYGTTPADPEPVNWTRHDFYVSVYRSSELGWMNSWQNPEVYLLGTTGIGNQEPFNTSTDFVLWAIASAHHDPHDEDHAMGDPPDEVNGVTLIHWSGLDLVPHNLMSWNPLGAPVACDPQFCPLPTPCSAFYKFDESGNSIIDSSGSGMNGTAVNTAHVPGLVNTALQFNGSSAYVSVPDSPVLDFGTGSFTIEGWVRPNAPISSTQVILDKRTETSPNTDVFGYSFFLYSTGALGFQLGTGTYVNYLSSMPVTINKWSHVAAVVDRSGPCPSVTLYIDGLRRGRTFLKIPASATVDNASQMWIGRNLFSGAGYLNGDLDEIALYPRALSQKEILCIRDVGSGGKL